VGGAGQRRLGRRVIGVEELVGLVVVLGAFAVAADVSRRGEEECGLKLRNGIFQCCFFVGLNRTNEGGIIKLSLFLVKSSLNEITTICNSLNKNIRFITILK